MGQAADNRGQEQPSPREAELLQPSSIRAFRFDHTGIRRVLGTLEADVLEAVWRLAREDATSPGDWTTIAAVCRALGPSAHYKTIQTVMNRLVEKHFLARRKRLRAFEYRALISEHELEARVTRSVVEGLLHDFGESAIARLVKVVHDVRPDQLALLEQLAGRAASAGGETSGETSGDTAQATAVKAGGRSHASRSPDRPAAETEVPGAPDQRSEPDRRRMER